MDLRDGRLFQAAFINNLLITILKNMDPINIYFNDELVRVITIEEQKVIAHKISEEDINADIKRRISWIVDELVNVTKEQIKQEWRPKLSATLESVPTRESTLLDLIMQQPDYKDRKTRNAELEAERLAAEAEAERLKNAEPIIP